MPTDTRRAVLGGALLTIGTATLVASGVPGDHVPAALGSVAVLLLAVGSLLVGLSGEDATV